jgi:phosphoribosyl-AMP cyclohydrolase
MVRRVEKRNHNNIAACRYDGYSPRPYFFRDMTMSGATVRFQARTSIEQVEEGNDLAPRFDDRGLITVVTTDADSGEVLMQGFMNTEALQLTISTGEAHYYSRSRQVLWHKGATSGLVQTVRELLVDDDQDCIWLRVDVAARHPCLARIGLHLLLRPASPRYARHLMAYPTPAFQDQPETDRRPLSHRQRAGEMLHGET